MLYQTFKEKKTQLNAKTKASVVDRYGNVGQAAPDEELLLGQTERCGSLPLQYHLYCDEKGANFKFAMAGSCDHIHSNLLLKEDLLEISCFATGRSGVELSVSGGFLQHLTFLLTGRLRSTRTY